MTSPEFVGREHELASLVAGLDRAADGRPAVALVAGESASARRASSSSSRAARASGARAC
jgi:predicted ATPase